VSTPTLKRIVLSTGSSSASSCSTKRRTLSSYALLAPGEGVKNYMTPEGHRCIQDELRQLLRVERPKVVETVAWAAGNGDRSENGTTSMASAACAKLIGVSVSYPSGWRAPTLSTQTSRRSGTRSFSARLSPALTGVGAE
jgi:Transcription elongation factor, N-terminal